MWLRPEQAHVNRRSSFSFPATPNGNCLLKAWSWMPAYSRRAWWMCSGRVRMPWSLSMSRICGLIGTSEEFRNQFHLIGVVVVVAVKLTDGQIR